MRIGQSQKVVSKAIIGEKKKGGDASTPAALEIEPGPVRRDKQDTADRKTNRQKYTYTYAYTCTRTYTYYTYFIHLCNIYMHIHILHVHIFHIHILHIHILHIHILHIHILHIHITHTHIIHITIDQTFSRLTRFTILLFVKHLHGNFPPGKAYHISENP